MKSKPFSRTHWLYAGIIIIVGLLIFANSLNNPFIYDDEAFIVRNEGIHHLTNMKAIMACQPRRWVATWTFALNYTLGGLDVRGYHLFNVLVHIGCGLLVSWLFVLLLSVPKWRNNVLEGQKEILGLWAGLIFVTHPLVTTAVDQITQRYCLIEAFFYLTCVCCYIKARLSTGNTCLGFGVLAAVSAVLALLSRESSVTLPLMLVMLELWGWNEWKRWKDNRWPLGLAGVALVTSVVIVLWAYKFNIGRYFLSAHYLSQSHPGEKITATNYFLTEFRVILIYVRLLGWPVLNFDYDMHVSVHWWDFQVIVSAIGTGCLLVYSWLVRQRLPLISWGIWWFFIVLSAESTFFALPYVIVEYRMYLPLAGCCMALVVAAATIIKDSRILTLVMGSIVLVFALLTMQRNLVYQDAFSLWTDTIQKSPYKSRPYSNLGAAYVDLKDYDNAVIYLRKAVMLEPGNYETMANLAQVYAIQGKFDEALKIDAKLIRRHPTAAVFNNIGVIYYMEGDMPSAERYFIKATHSRYAYPEIYFNLARVYLNEGRAPEAQEALLKGRSL